jgi:hypothetical protein
MCAPIASAACRYTWRQRTGTCRWCRYEPAYLNSDAKVANRDVWGFGWEIAHEAVSRRPPIPLFTIVARTNMHTYTAKVWDLSLVQGPFSVAPCQTLTLRFAACSSPYEMAHQLTCAMCVQVLAGRAAEVCASPDQWLYAEALADVMQLVGRSLLVGSAWVNEPDDEGMTPLHLAARAGHVEVRRHH